MTGFLRIVGILNAAIWLGAATFFTFGAGAAAASPEMQHLLGPKNFPYFSNAFAQILAARYAQVQLVCSAVVVLHLVAEWLYSGKVPEKLWRWCLLSAIVANLFCGFWVQPKMAGWNVARYAVNARPEKQFAADRAFRAWQSVASAVNFLTVAGLAVYLWRVATLPDPTRYVSPAKFRG